MDNDNFGQWGILELMGHVRIAGYITEVELFGSKLGRIDIPGDDPSKFELTQYFGGSSVYRITPITEEVARAFASRNKPRPVALYELDIPRESNYPDQFEIDDDDLDDLDDLDESPF